MLTRPLAGWLPPWGQPEKRFSQSWWRWVVPTTTTLQTSMDGIELESCENIFLMTPNLSNSSRFFCSEFPGKIPRKIWSKSRSNFINDCWKSMNEKRRRFVLLLDYFSSRVVVVKVLLFALNFLCCPKNDLAHLASQAIEKQVQKTLR